MRSRHAVLVLTALLAFGAAHAADPASSRELGAGNLPGSGANGNQSGAAPVGATVGGAGGGVGNTGRSGTAGPRITVQNPAAVAAARGASTPASAASARMAASAPRQRTSR
jgi:hypothetical protein